MRTACALRLRAPNSPCTFGVRMAFMDLTRSMKRMHCHFVSVIASEHHTRARQHVSLFSLSKAKWRRKHRWEHAREDVNLDRTSYSHDD
ncbi:uncharacterized protein MYCFIDRAFT_212585 [Pseudocercospora fijiensis CIRAD86]|uniref:Uncharacterized protein n=1 Tax=Pseudocercospora fijiensis (strain CIRAD86) TaxID=383855 RepID=M3AL68_PSEFD|nr:uncharacterized protein MYCFIDRAFT_212585 [Pseudocercospora fijiensis CIRAD86]EME77898.1 hypothetical protein MYCFIDRAFT_212585 [Pseudocercospora fijiensis CIRAD86]